MASLKEPEPPKGLKDAGKLLAMARALWDMKPAMKRSAPCQEMVLTGEDIDLGSLPVQTCWPGDAGPLITWGLVVTRGPQTVASPRLRQNLLRSCVTRQKPNCSRRNVSPQSSVQRNRIHFPGKARAIAAARLIVLEVPVRAVEALHQD